MVLFEIIASKKGANGEESFDEHVLLAIIGNITCLASVSFLLIIKNMPLCLGKGLFY